MAESLWKALCGADCPAESAGVAAWPGQSAQEYAVEAVRPYGADLEHHRSRDLHHIQSEFDLIFVMTYAQAREVGQIRPQWQAKTHVLPAFLGQEGEIGDPLGSNQVYYDSLAWRLHRLLTLLKEQLGQEASANAAETGE
jgi:protein-tyrosine-phosphatase